MVWTKEVWSRWNAPNLVARADVTVAVNICGLDSLEKLALPGPPRPISINERMLNEEINTDLTIVAGNGAKIKCHKVYLMVRSPVLKAMFKSEATTSTLKMEAMTEASVRAFLAYLYHSDTTEARKVSEVALEMFEAGHKYDVEGLEDAMEGIIVGKNDKEWFTLDMVIRLFMFARKFDEFRADFLKTKAVNVLSLKSM